MNLQDIECEVMDWINLACNRDRWRVLVEHGNKPSGYTEPREELDFF